MSHEPSAEQLLAQALEELEVSVCVADATLPDLPLVWANRAFTRTTGYDVEDVLGRNCRFLQDGLPPQPAREELRAAIAAAQPCQVVLQNRRADGSVFANELTLTPLHDDAGRLTHYLALQRDVSAAQRDGRENQRLLDEREELARQLQRSVAPRRLADPPGLDVGLRYDAGSDGASGDFYDLFATASSVGGAPTWNAAMGDVAGRGAAAAAYTATVRTMLKGIAQARRTPSHTLQLLNQALLDELGDRFVTVVLAQLQVRPDRVRAQLALGGHPQPVVVRDGSAELVGEPGDLLGVLDDVQATDTRVDLAPGDALLLYTDGVTEAGAPHEQFGEERLLQAAQDAAGAGAQVLVEGVADAVRQHAGATEDDSALLALEVEGPGTR